MNLKKIPSDERPREKLIRYGAATLTNSELLAIVISTGNKKENVLELSSRFFRNYSIKSLSRLKIGSLKKQLGIGDAKACRMIACFELGRRLSAFRSVKEPVIENPETLARLFIPEMAALEKEYFKGIYLDSGKKIIKQETIFIGSLNESVIHPREIFKAALEENAAALILLHNHPSGDPYPSPADIKVTKKIIEGGKILGIEVLDHIIIGDNKFISLKKEGFI